jgi:hypothetical protein
VVSVDNFISSANSEGVGEFLKRSCHLRMIFNAWLSFSVSEIIHLARRYGRKYSITNGTMMADAMPSSAKSIFLIKTSRLWGSGSTLAPVYGFDNYHYFKL